MGPSVLGYEFITEVEVYYLTAAVVLVASILMYLFSRTPAGRMANAVRDNPERAEFVGYSQRAVRFISFCASGLFAGMAGGLFAINYEIVTEENLNLTTSGWVLLMVYIGGVGYFVGPIVGAVLLTLLQTVLSNYTEIWQLYVGILFVLTVMYLPSGLTGIVMMHEGPYRQGRLGTLAVPYLRAGVPLALFLAGTVALLELLHHLNSAAVGRSTVEALGTTIDMHSPVPWGLSVACAVVGAAGLRRTVPGLRAAWDASLAPAAGDSR